MDDDPVVMVSSAESAEDLQLGVNVTEPEDNTRTSDMQQVNLALGASAGAKYFEKRKSEKDRRLGVDRRRGPEERRVEDKPVKKDRRKAKWSRRAKGHERRFSGERRRETQEDEKIAIQQESQYYKIAPIGTVLKNELEKNVEEPLPDNVAPPPPPENAVKEPEPPLPEPKPDTVLDKEPIKDEQGNIIAYQCLQATTEGNATGKLLQIVQPMDIICTASETILRYQEVEYIISYGITQDEYLIIDTSEAITIHFPPDVPGKLALGWKKPIRNFAERSNIPTITLALGAIGRNIEYHTLDHFQIGKVDILMLQSQIVELLAENGARCKISGPSGPSRLKSFKQQLRLKPSLSEPKSQDTLPVTSSGQKKELPAISTSED